jgi:hypothetical protein
MRQASGTWVTTAAPGLKAEARQVLEVAVPFAALGVSPGARIAWFLSILLNGSELERYPTYQALEVTVPPAEFEAYNWTA